MTPHFLTTSKEIDGFLNLSKLSNLYSAHSQYDKRFVAMYGFDC